MNFVRAEVQPDKQDDYITVTLEDNRNCDSVLGTENHGIAKQPCKICWIVAYLTMQNSYLFHMMSHGSEPSSLNAG